MDRAPDEDPPRRSSWRRRAPLVAIAALLLTGGLLLALGTARQQPAPPPAADKGAPPAAAPHSSAPSTEPRATALPPSRPVSITIPSLEVTSDLEQLGLGKNRAMETPKDPAKAGWYRPGTTPGAIGPSVIAGHVTWDGVPAVFFKLTELDPGDRIDVRRADGTTAVFTVDRTATYPKDDFPTVEVYRNLDHAGLRLITCGGDFSEKDSRYADNVVVYASLTGHRGR
ncbi:class F sortase [Streptomyces sp. ME02-6991-2A]|uniref:class F sortase n=1 Tax=Streptomyces TaxID=1883 RepID=UPI0010085897|nr:class F sortase [Streptomyces sp. ME02-6991-2A]MDX3376093.1 class F sortase [Streptomyces sp. ME02-6991-2A]